MAKVQLSDIIDKTLFVDMEAQDRPEKTAFFESGVVVSDPLANQICASAGQESELPYWQDLDPTEEPNYSDDQSAAATPKKVVQAEQKARKSFLNQGWSATDLARELQMNTDAMRHIRNRVDTYWTRQWQRRVVACTKGILAANVNNNITAGFGTAADMIVNVAIANGASATADNYFDRDAFTAALFTMQDYSDRLSAILIHSVVHKRMVDNDDIDYIVDSQGRPSIPTYMGHRVIVDDGCPVYTAAGDPGPYTVTSGAQYVSTLYGPSAFAYGASLPTVPVEVEREAAMNAGGGEETLWTRKTWLLHPLGHTNTGAVKTGNTYSQTLADLADEANWSRTHYRKNVPMAFLVTNG